MLPDDILEKLYSRQLVSLTAERKRFASVLPALGGNKKKIVELKIKKISEEILKITVKKNNIGKI